MNQSLSPFTETSHSLEHFYAPYSYFDESTKEKIQKHLTDINDIITEDDIRNIDTSLTLRNEAIAVPFIEKRIV
jgi:hypothetical protein